MAHFEGLVVPWWMRDQGMRSGEFETMGCDRGRQTLGENLKENGITGQDEGDAGG